MNVVFNFRVVLTSILITGFVVIPRILNYFQLNHPIIAELTAPWATFLVVFSAIILLFYSFLKNIRYFLIFLVIAILVAFGLTLYFCDLPLLW